MSRPLGPTYGRAAMIGVLIALLLLICAGIYAFVARYGVQNLPLGADANDPLGVDLADPAAESRRLARLTILLTILLISSLLILLFVIGSYLLIHVGRIVRAPLAGKPTVYSDAWQGYRITEAQIAAATAELPPDGNAKPGTEPPAPEPPTPGPDHPGPES